MSMPETVILSTLDGADGLNDDNLLTCNVEGLLVFMSLLWLGISMSDEISLDALYEVLIDYQVDPEHEMPDYDRVTALTTPDVTVLHYRAA